MLEPAVNGAKYVIDAAAKAKVKRVVFTSSIGAVYMNPNRDPQAIVDENCWSDLEFCKNTKVFFFLQLYWFLIISILLVNFLDISIGLLIIK